MSEPRTALDTFRAQAQVHPWHFWGMAGSGPAAVTLPSDRRGNCRPIIRQYGWQAGDAVSRSQIAQALVQAEDLVREHLGYGIAPAFREATIAPPTPTWGRFADATGAPLSIALPEGEVRAIGVEAFTVLAEAAAVDYHDDDGDTLYDRFTVTVADASTPLDEIGVYVSAADRFDGSGLSSRWQLRPTVATRAAGIVTITGRAWTAVQPVRYEGTQAAALNGLDPAGTIYLDSVTVARRYADASGTTPATAAAVLIWEAGPYPWCACPAGTTSDPAGVWMAVARVGIRDARAGIVTPVQAVYDASTGTWAAADCATWWGCRPPDRVTVRYLAGLPLHRGEVAPPWDRLIAGLAASMLARPLAGCEDTQSLIAQWQTDVTRAAGGTTFQAQPSADNPFGPRRGQIDASQEVRRRKLIRGVAG